MYIEYQCRICKGNKVMRVGNLVENDFNKDSRYYYRIEQSQYYLNPGEVIESVYCEQCGIQYSLLSVGKTYP